MPDEDQITLQWVDLADLVATWHSSFWMHFNKKTQRDIVLACNKPLDCVRLTGPVKVEVDGMGVGQSYWRTGAHPPPILILGLTCGSCDCGAVAGILGQEALGRSPEWFNVGGEPQWLPDSALLAIEFFVIGHFEVKRYQGWNKHKTVRPVPPTLPSRLPSSLHCCLGVWRWGLGACVITCTKVECSEIPGVAICFVEASLLRYISHRT